MAPPPDPPLPIPTAAAAPDTDEMSFAPPAAATTAAATMPNQLDLVLILEQIIRFDRTKLIQRQRNSFRGFHSRDGHATSRQNCNAAKNSAEHRAAVDFRHLLPPRLLFPGGMQVSPETEGSD